MRSIGEETVTVCVDGYTEEDWKLVDEEERTFWEGVRAASASVPLVPECVSRGVKYVPSR